MTTASPKAQALAILDDLPDSAMSLVGWAFDEHGIPERPCTRDEVRGLIMSGEFSLEQMTMSAELVARAEEPVTQREALQRRRTMRAV